MHYIAQIDLKYRLLVTPYRDEARKKFRGAEQKFYIKLALILPLVNID